MLKISIPAPCHENWDAMTPNQQGRHCTSCAKTVVDFTLMSDDAIKYFFLHQQEKSTCGRFRNDQLERITITLPKDIFQIHLPLWKQFLTACLLAFSSMLFSCDAVVQQDKTATHQTVGVIAAGDKKQRDQEVIFGGINVNMDSIPAPTLPVPVCAATKGITFVYDSIGATQGMIDIRLTEPPAPIIEEAAVQVPLIDSANIDLDNASLQDTTQTKNPPVADSTGCNNRKYY